jgi:hypothetical protein
LAETEREHVARHDKHEREHFRAMNMHHRAADVRDAMADLARDRPRSAQDS